MHSKTTGNLIIRRAPAVPATNVQSIAAIPEEAIWLAKLKSERTRRAYRSDVRHFMCILGIQDGVELRQVTHKHVIAWDHYMREHEQPPPSAATIRRRLAALSSLFRHLVDHTELTVNPVREVRRPPKDSDGQTPAFARKQARAVLDAPPESTLLGLRDRAILSVGLQAGLRRAEITQLRVKDLIQTRGYDALRIRGKRNKRRTVIVNPQTAGRIKRYLAVCGHADDLDGPLFRPTRHNQKCSDPRRALNSDGVARIVRKYARTIGIERGYAAHALRATWITTALENGADLKDVQRDAGHADVSTTRLYDRRGHNPEKSAAFFATY